jgi:hypothetical protein
MKYLNKINKYFIIGLTIGLTIGFMSIIGFQSCTNPEITPENPEVAPENPEVTPENPKVTPQKTELVSQWDIIRPLANPDKGWYHHLFDNGIRQYAIQNDSIFASFPGMDHLYLRLAWAFLEPEEGQFDWSYIDDIVDKYVPMGYKISFRITCKETEGAPHAVPKEVNGIRYATPYWVIQAGAKGIERPPYGTASWTPEWGDPVFLEKLDNFHKAFAVKYDGKPWVRYVDVGSIGDWGEGQTWYSTRISPTMEEMKMHLDLYLKHYKQTQLIVTDDFLANAPTEKDKTELLDFAIQNRISIRDDSPMVSGYMTDVRQTWTVIHPYFFEAAYKTMPTVFELDHYRSVKSAGFWLGENGKNIIPEYGVSGADIFRNAVKIMRPTYVGYHGYLEDWLNDNPDFTKEILNLCGYWYFPKSVTTEYKNGNLSFEIQWQNKGVALAYNIYQLRGKLIPTDNSSETIFFEIEDSGNKNWMPDEIATENYTVSLPDDLKGSYQFAIQLFDKKSETPVEIGLITDMKKEDYFVIQNLII